MIETRQLELDDARKAIAAATQEAVANGWKVGISVVDAGGHLLLFERMDGAAPSTVRVSFEKAYTAAIFRTATAGMEDRIADRPGMMILPGATPLKGGVPLVSGGQVVGAIGISGVAPHQDHQIAEAGAATVG